MLPGEGAVLLGLDVGGSSIKAGLVDVARGDVLDEVRSVATPRPATVEAVVAACAGLQRELGAKGPAGVGVPSVVQRGVTRTAAHIHESWIDTDAGALFRQALGAPVALLNDADAAGLAEMHWGAGRDSRGVAIMVTFGTGIGTAIFMHRQLLPNTELGHLTLRGMDAEEWASARVRTRDGLAFDVWAGRVNEYLAELHRLFWPDLFILGGAVSERFAEFGTLLRSRAEIRPALFGNQAGILGSAMAAALLESIG